MKHPASQSPHDRSESEPKVWKTAADKQRNAAAALDAARRPREIGGRKDGLEPTRYGDWEKNGRCIDF